MIDEILLDADERMDKTVVALQTAFSKIRSGRANPALLDGVTIEYYGAETPLKHLSGISVEEGRTLVITPFEKKVLKDIEKSLLSSGLGITPINNGENIRLPLPPLTEENRKQLIRQAREETEGARVSARNIRRDARKDIQELVSEKEASETEGHAAETAIQEITDSHIKNLEALLDEKEKDLLTI